MEFDVKSNKLKNEASTLEWSDRELKKAQGSIESALKKISLGDSTDIVKGRIRESNEKLTFLGGVVSTASKNLTSIAHEYRNAEAKITNRGRSLHSLQISDLVGDWCNKALEKFDDVIYKGKNLYNKYAGDPVNLDNGNFVYENSDLVIGGGEQFAFSRFYNSLNKNDGALGTGWIHSFEMSLKIEDESIVASLNDGKKLIFGKDSKGGFVLMTGGTYTLTSEDGGYRLFDEDLYYLFDEAGHFIRCENDNGRGYSLEFEGDLPIKIVRDSGEFFVIIYTDNGERIASVTDHIGRSVNYTYNGTRLETMVCGDRITAYEYDAAGNMTGIITPDGVRILSNEYDLRGRVTGQSFADGSEMKYGYDEENNFTVLAERNGQESYHYHDALSRNIENVYRNGTESFEYYDNNQISYESDRNGNETRYQYDNRGNVTKTVLASGDVINITYEKHNKPASISINGVRKQKNVYDERGNLIESVDALGRKTSTKYNEEGFPVEIRTPGGNTTKITYDERGNIVNLIDEQGVNYRYEYDKLNRVVKAVKGSNNEISFEYDAFDNVTKVSDAAGSTRSYKYNKLDKITEFVDFNGAKSIAAYNTLGFISKMTDPDGHTVEYEYDEMWNTSVERLPNGGVLQSVYDENNDLIVQIDPLGNKTSYEYDGNGNMIARVDAEGGISEFAYGPMDELILSRDPEGNETRFEYDAEGNMTCVSAANGSAVHMEYDEASQLIRETNSLGESREYTYTPDGDLASVTDEAGRVLSMYYSSKGKLSRIVQPTGVEESIVYDENGNVSRRSNNQGFETKYTYDALDRVIEKRSNNGECFTYTYDELGNITSTTDAYGNTTKYEYTLRGQLSAVTDELGNRTEYDYDELNMLVGIMRIGDGEEHKTEYIRDLNENIVKAVDPLGFAEEFEYNQTGQLIKKIDKDGFITEYGYDLNGNMNSILFNDGKEITMEYDALGKLAALKDWTGVTSVESDILGRVTKVTYPDDRTAEYTYGRVGERTSIKYPDGRTVSYGYDDALRLVSLKEGDTEISYKYDGSGRLVSRAFAGGLVSDYAYDSKGRVTGIASTQSGTLLEKVTIGYDHNDNRVSAERFREGMPEQSGLFEYGYDGNGKLVSVSKDGNLLRTYTYDAFGNRASMQSDKGTVEYSYDAMDRLTAVQGDRTEEFRYDNRGNVTARLTDGKLTHSYVYGALNLLESAKSSEGNASYEYDGFGFRIEDKISRVHEPERKIRYTHDLTHYYNNVIEITDNGVTDAFIRDGILASVKGSHNYDYVCDDMGSPARILGVDGSSAEIYGYDEFGISTGDAASMQPFGYIGYRVDPIADMDHAQAREYMPEHGRFAGQDRIKGNTVAVLTLNAYIYCGGMPFKYYDPDGNFWHIVAGAAIGGIVNGGWELATQTYRHFKYGEDMSIGKILVSTASGAVSGGFTAAGMPVVGDAIGGFIEGTGHSLIDGDSIGTALKKGALEGGTSALFAGIGKGIEHLKLGDKFSDFVGKKAMNPDNKIFRKLDYLMKQKKLWDDKSWKTVYKRQTEIFNGFWKDYRAAVIPNLPYVMKGLGSGFISKIKGNFKKKIFNPKGDFKKIIKCAIGLN